LDFEKNRQSQNFLVLAMLKEMVFWVFSKEFRGIRACEFFYELIEVDLIINVACKVLKNVIVTPPK
jgi:hypothetical protein